MEELDKLYFKYWDMYLQNEGSKKRWDRSNYFETELPNFYNDILLIAD